MFRKFRQIFNTVKYLRPTQIFHQIYYRLKSKRTLAYFEKKKEVNFSKLKFIYVPSFKTELKQGNKFQFLNLQKDFNEIDWNFLQYGKLWNYNLQYFNYLAQNNIDDDSKEALILDIDRWLRTGDLLLEPYPVSLRVMNIIRYCSNKDNPKEAIIKAVYAQSRYLKDNFEYHLLGNHLLENAFALMMSGTFFNETSWVNKAKKVLYKELDEQILKDGGHFELSPMYHQIILFRVLELIDWYSNLDLIDGDFMFFVKNKAKCMLSWLENMTLHNGDIPHFNDSSSNISMLSSDLFKLADLLNLKIDGRIPLKESGYRKYSGNSYECIIDAGDLGASYQPGHSHADALSFVTYKDKMPFITEVGTSTYQIGTRRDYERSSSAHNTVVIGNQNQSQVWGGFRAGRRAKCSILKESSKSLEAHHDGYVRDFNVLHKRSFLFDESSIIIKDDIQNQHGEFHLHFHPNISISKVSDTAIEVDGIGIISFENATDMNLLEYEFSEGFNKYENALKLILIFDHYIKTSINFIS